MFRSAISGLRKRDMPAVFLAYIARRIFGGSTSDYLLWGITVKDRDGLRWLWGKGDLGIGVLSLVNKHEAEVGRWMYDVFPKGGVFVDVGANQGLYSIRLGMTASAVYSLEPNPTFLRILARNVDLNGMNNRITLVPLAAWDSDTTLKMTQLTIRSGGDFEVRAKPLDEIVQSPDPDLVKIDVEGAELRVLRGMQSLRPHYVFVEVHEFMGVTSGQVDSEMVGKGYALLKSKDTNGLSHRFYGRKT